jgi:Bacterial SH3 domain
MAALLLAASLAVVSGAPVLILLAVLILAAAYLWFLARRQRRRPESALMTIKPSPFGDPRPPMLAAQAAPPNPTKMKKTRGAEVEAIVPTSAAPIPAAPGIALVEPYSEALMPRWRRPSLKTARYARPRVEPTPSPALTFAAATPGGLERRLVRYDLVALTDIPDEIRGARVGQLQANDEVEITGRRGAWVQVRTPLGAEGWIHRTTLASTGETPEAIDSQPLPPPDGPAAPSSTPARNDGAPGGTRTHDL